MATAMRPVPTQTTSVNAFKLPEYTNDSSTTLGKIVQVKVKLTEGTDLPIALRGENGPLTWDKDHLGFDHNGIKNKRVFQFSISPEQMNQPLIFKCVKLGPQNVFWQKSDNITVDLSQGHVVTVKMKNVSFEG
jgi:hypothetical protein